MLPQRERKAIERFLDAAIRQKRSVLEMAWVILVG